MLTGHGASCDKSLLLDQLTNMTCFLQCCNCCCQSAHVHLSVVPPLSHHKTKKAKIHLCLTWVVWINDRNSGIWGNPLLELSYQRSYINHVTASNFFWPITNAAHTLCVFGNDLSLVIASSQIFYVRCTFTRMSKWRDADLRFMPWSTANSVRLILIKLQVWFLLWWFPLWTESIISATQFVLAKPKIWNKHVCLCQTQKQVLQFSKTMLWSALFPMTSNSLISYTQHYCTSGDASTALRSSERVSVTLTCPLFGDGRVYCVAKTNDKIFNTVHIGRGCAS